MKMNEGRASGAHLIRRYDAEAVTVLGPAGADDATITEKTVVLPVLVAADGIDTTLDSPSIAELTPGDVERIAARRPAIVLAGSAAANTEL